MTYDYAYAKRWRIERERGLTRTKDAARTAAYLDTLREAGWTYRGIADASGVPVQTVHKVHRREQPSVANNTETKILALRPDSIFTRPNKDGFVPNVGARRRLKALMAIGWRHADLTERTGFRTAVMLHQIGDSISRSKHDAMVRVYDELWDKPGPSQKGRDHAVKAGYLPPLAWDDDTIDDPNAEPASLVRPGKGERREANVAAFIDDVEFLLRTGATMADIGARLGVGDAKSVERRLYRHGRGDLAARAA